MKQDLIWIWKCIKDKPFVMALRNGLIISGITGLGQLLGYGRFPTGYELYVVALTGGLAVMLELANAYGIAISGKKGSYQPILFK